MPDSKMDKISKKLNRDLTYWGPVDGKILYPSFWFRPIACLVKKRWGVRWAEWTGVFEPKNRMTFYYDAQEMSRQGAKTIETWIRPPNQRKRLWQAYEKMQKSLQRSAREIKELIERKESLTRGALRKSGSLWYDCMMDMWSIGVVPELANYGAPAYLLAKIKPFVPREHQPQVLEALLAPQWLSFHQQSEKEFFKIVIISSSKEELKKRMESYVKKWYWVQNSYFESRNLSPNDFLKTLKSLSRKKIFEKYTAIKNHPKNIIRRKKEIIKKWNLSPSIFQLANALSFSIWWQDHRKGLSWWAHSIVDILSWAAAKKFDIEFDTIMTYTAEEWKNLLVSGVLVLSSKIQERNKLTIFILSDGKVTEYTGKKAKVIVDNLRAEILKPKMKGGRIITGIGVSRGISRGVVCILLSPRDLWRMKKGGILVAPMTSPDYVVAMRKAKGVITDVGGLMSHAAIISRELGIPCVVGTKVATESLRDGDKVEVDGERGLVKILGKTK
jgi:phosphohistidine swiveling domain-containing protein